MPVGTITSCQTHAMATRNETGVWFLATRKAEDIGPRPPLGVNSLFMYFSRRPRKTSKTKLLMDAWTPNAESTKGE